MGLPDMPPEIFQRIVHALVSQAGVCKAWDYRQVCRVFASEIYHDVFTNQPMTAFKTFGAVNLLEHDFGLFLFNRTKNLLDADPFLPGKIMKMKDYLVKANDNHTVPKQEDITETLCKFVNLDGDLSSSWSVVLLRGGLSDYQSCMAPLNIDLSLVDKLAAAVAMGRMDLFKSLMAQSTDEVCQESIPCGIPLLGMIKRPLDMLKFALQHLDEQAYQAKTSKRGLALILAITTAIEQRNAEATACLLSWFLKHYMVGKDDYDKWLKICIRGNDPAIMRILLGAPNLPTPRVSFRMFERACRSNSSEVIKEVLSSDEIDIHSKYGGKKLRYWPLETAVMHGNIQVVRTVLKAGPHKKVVLLACELRARKKKDLDMHELLQIVLEVQERVDIKPYKPRKVS